MVYLSKTYILPFEDNVNKLMAILVISGYEHCIIAFDCINLFRITVSLLSAHYSMYCS